VKLIHLSDIHLTIPGQKMAGLDTHHRLARALEHMCQYHADAERLVITGDLAHWGEAEAYDALRDALAVMPVDIAVRLLIGNHDNRNTFLSAFPDQACDARGYVNYSETVGDQRFIYLDSCERLTHSGHFGADRCEWLNAELSNTVRARIFMHHNPLLLGLPAADKIALNVEDRALFRDVIEAHRDRIEYIHFGHVHAPIHGTYCGIPFSCVPSTGNQGFPDLAEPEDLSGAPMAPAYAVILIDGPQTIIHQIPFTWDGPVFHVGTRWEDWSKSSK